VRKIILVGGGGHCRSAIDVLETQSKYKIFGILDNNLAVDENILNYKILGNDDNLRSFLKSVDYFLITVGQIKNPFLRLSCFQRVLDAGGKFATVISSRAHVSKYSEIKTGTIVMHGALINSHARIGQNTIINSMSLIEHDCVIGDHTHVSTGALINGGVLIGDRSFIGSGAIIKEGVKIGDDVIIGSGSVIKHNIASGSKIV
jgi:sugar O-acyltransferase (sialic acid O-acetyltransferase NeuD family)